MHTLACILFALWCLSALALTLAVCAAAAEPRNRRAHNLGRRLAWGTSVKRIL